VSFTATATGGVRKGLSFHASSTELREIAFRVLEAADKADALLAKIQGRKQ
jgi:hypothetical protein